MPITRTPMVDDDGTGQTGTVVNNPWKVELYDQIDAAIASGAASAWTNVAFNASNFYSTDAGTLWTVHTQFTNAYSLMGKTLIWTVFVHSTIAGNPARLFCQLPAGLVPALKCFGANNYYSETAAQTENGTTETTAGLPRIDVMKTFTAVPWPAGSTYLAFTATMPVQ